MEELLEKGENGLGLVVFGKDCATTERVLGNDVRDYFLREERNVTSDGEQGSETDEQQSGHSTEHI